MPRANPRPLRLEVLDDPMAAVLRKKTGAQRQAIANAMFHSVRTWIESSIRNRHPDWTDQQIARETALRISHGATASHGPRATTSTNR